ncbi:MAG: hypothetical protein M3P83_03030, partial [Actinomycetota bacterium]|nr:hypothetical protein [Actinomycetota bacterium]
MVDRYDVWYDDLVIEALARRRELDIAAARGRHDGRVITTLSALSALVDSDPIPEDETVDPVQVVRQAREHRLAVRSLALAVGAVSLLSTSGISAAVSGDPLRPARAVYEQVLRKEGPRESPQTSSPDVRHERSRGDAGSGADHAHRGVSAPPVAEPPETLPAASTPTAVPTPPQPGPSAGTDRSRRAEPPKVFAQRTARTRFTAEARSPAEAQRTARTRFTAEARFTAEPRSPADASSTAEPRSTATARSTADASSTAEPRSTATARST